MDRLIFALLSKLSVCECSQIPAFCATDCRKDSHSSSTWLNSTSTTHSSTTYLVVSEGKNIFIWFTRSIFDFIPSAVQGHIKYSFCRLSKLKILECRENHLKTLPKSLSRLTYLERLDIGNNDFTELASTCSHIVLYLEAMWNNLFLTWPCFSSLQPEVVGSLTGLLELWCDCNRITTFPSVSEGNRHCLLTTRTGSNRSHFEWYLRTKTFAIANVCFQGIGNLKQLMFLDASKNRIETLPAEIDGCISLADLHLSTNLLQQLPENIGGTLVLLFSHFLNSLFGMHFRYCWIFVSFSFQAGWAVWRHWR